MLFNVSKRSGRVAAVGNGFTIIEVLVTTFLIGTVVVGLFSLFILGLRSAQDGERRIAAIALANERMEMVRNLPYQAVGTVDGVPSGSILQNEDLVRNGLTYTVKTDIRYVDDPYDGVGGDADPNKVTICHKPPGNPGGQQTLQIPPSALSGHLSHGDTEGPCEGDPDPEGNDLVNTDYKQVRVEVSWPSPQAVRPVLLITQIAPQGIEEGELYGTLDFQALDANGVPVAGATVTFNNDAVTPPVAITTQTNSDGRYLLPGLPPGDSYELTVSKANYTTEQTYDVAADFIPDADHSHLVMIAREITSKTFLIDRVATLQVATDDEEGGEIANVPYTLQGTKTRGQDGEGEPVYVVEIATQTGATGTASHTLLPWDTYDIVINGAVTGYDLKEAVPPLPLPLDPAETADLSLVLIPHTPISLQVTVVNAAGEPIDNATVHVTAIGYDQTQGTGAPGQVYFGDLPNNGDYTVEVQAPGLASLTDTVTVSGTTRMVITLTP